MTTGSRHAAKALTGFAVASCARQLGNKEQRTHSNFRVRILAIPTFCAPLLVAPITVQKTGHYCPDSSNHSSKLARSNALIMFM
jgi:hypothetical protein